MGYALFVTFDRSIPGIDGSDLSGKVLALNIETLDDVARRLNLLPLGELISISDEELEDLLDDDIEGVGEEQWFPTATGLAILNTLVPFVRENPDQFKQTSDLLEDLTQIQHYLECAEQYQAMFHLTPDF